METEYGVLLGIGPSRYQDLVIRTNTTVSPYNPRSVSKKSIRITCYSLGAQISFSGPGIFSSKFWYILKQEKMMGLGIRCPHMGSSEESLVRDLGRKMIDQVR